jgi:hypothetical protein
MRAAAANQRTATIVDRETETGERCADCQCPTRADEALGVDQANSGRDVGVLIGSDCTVVIVDGWRCQDNVAGPWPE